MVKLITAIDDNGGIGIDNKLPWSCPEDLQHFKSTTEGQTVIMGRSTWESLPVKPLPNRRNIVITSSNLLWEDKYSSIEAALGSLEEDEDVFVIGGKMLYESVLKMGIVDQMIISRIPGEYMCDTFFPLEFRDEYCLKQQKYMNTFKIEIYENGKL